MTKLYTRVSPEFDHKALNGVVIASAELGDTYGFTELGYDEVDYDVAPTVLEITSKAERYADTKDVYAAAEKTGMRLWMTRDEYMKEWPGAKEDQFEEGAYLLLDDGEPNQLLANPEIRRHLEEAGFDAFHDSITVSNTQPEVYAFWKASSFEISGPVEVVAEDPNEPYQVKLALEAPDGPKA